MAESISLCQVHPTQLYCNSQLSFSPRIQDATREALDEDELEDDIDPVTRPPLSPRKPKSKPGPKRLATADLSRKFPPQATHPTWEK